MMQRIRWFLLLTGIVVVLVLSLWNTENVTIKIPFFEDHELPLAMLLLATAASSFVFGALMTGWMLRGFRKSPGSEKEKNDESPTSSNSGKQETASTPWETA